MKNPSQIRRRDSSAACVAQPKAAPRSRVKVRVSRELSAAVENAARKRGLTKSQFAESAIREELARVGAAGKGRGAKPRRPQPKAAPRLTNQKGRVKHATTTTLSAETGVPGVIFMRSGEIKTGALGWRARDQFDRAVRAGRFLCTEIPCNPDAAPNERRYERFLESLTAEQLHALRDSVPLYWIDDQPGFGDGLMMLISYRGELPDSAPADFGKAAAAILANRISPTAMDIPQDWSEVAAIDFTGYLDRDCEERIIYKTPEGELKARKSFAGGGTVIENVTRPQVARWLLECVIPEEFEPDFRRALPDVAAKGGAN